MNFNLDVLIYAEKLNCTPYKNLSEIIGKNYTITNDILYKNSSELNPLEEYLKKNFENNVAGSITIIVYAIIMLLGIFGNSCIIFRLLTSRRPITRENLIFLNLSVVDFLIVSSIVPVELYWKTQYVWEIGTVICKIFHFFKNYFLYLSSFITVVIAYNRHRALVDRLSFLHENRRNKIILTLGYIFFFIISIPQTLLFHVEKHKKCLFNQCIGFNTSFDNYIEWYNIFEMMFMFVIPMLLTIYFYFPIVKGLLISKCNFFFNNNNGQRDGIAGQAQNHINRIQRAKKWAVIVAFIVPIKFLVCWSLHFIFVVLDVIDKESTRKLNNSLIHSFFIIELFSSVINPILMYPYVFNNYVRKPNVLLRNKNRKNSRSNSLEQIEYKTNLNTLCFSNEETNNDIEMKPILKTTPKTVYTNLKDEPSDDIIVMETSV